MDGNHGPEPGSVAILAFGERPDPALRLHMSRGLRSVLAGLFRIAAVCAVMGLIPQDAMTAPAQSQTRRIAQICDDAAGVASRETGVPLQVLLAITRTETGRSREGVVTPWPWTVNMEGRGVWFDTESEALSFVFDHFKTGARSFDVGCFQINYKWHGAQFASIEQMFEPLANARYAASFLKSLFGESGDWSRAAGAFHSRTPVYAERYIARFNTVFAELGPPGLQNPVLMGGYTGPRANRFPLLQAGAAGTLGSLVPLEHAGASGAVVNFYARPEG